MKLKLIEKRKNEFPLYIGDTSSYILNIKNQSVYKTNDFKSKEWEIEGLNGKVFVDKNHSVLFANDNQITFVDSAKGEIVDIEKCTLIEVKKDTNGWLADKFLCYKNPQIADGKILKTIGYLNLKEDEFQIINEAFEFNEILSLKESFIVKRKNHLYSYDLKLKNKLWEFSSSRFPTYKDHWGKDVFPSIKEILGIYKNLLWLHIDKLHLVAIDINNGLIKHHIKNVLVEGSTLKHYFLDTERGCIKIFAQNTYREFDLHHLVLIKDSKIELGKEFIVRAVSFYLGDDNIYFSAYYGETFPNVFGVFDTGLCEISCLEFMKLDGDGNALFNPPYSNDKFLVIRDNKNILHTYRKML